MALSGGDERSVSKRRLVIRGPSGKVILDLSERPELIKMLKYGDIEGVWRVLKEEQIWKRIRCPPGTRKGRSRGAPIPGKVRTFLLLMYGPDYPLWVKNKRKKTIGGSGMKTLRVVIRPISPVDSS